MFAVNILGLNFSSNQKTRTFATIIWAPRAREGPEGVGICFSTSHKGKKGEGMEGAGQTGGRIQQTENMYT